MTGRKNVDISELYDLFRNRKNCYFVCCDIKRLIPINAISHKAGDLAIIESMRRMDEAAGNQDVVFRVGGDEFALLTDQEDINYANEIADKIKESNGKGFAFEDGEIPLTLHVSITKMDSPNIRYDQLFKKIHSSLDEVK